ncbi:Phosphate metabolism transcription is regulated by PHO system [Pseudogymnoascus destructans]|uniref:Endopolyphosphatase n=2 Tax=Pseudogymnoascus destructans TaxID=655981 RepID=L8G9N0_PSED2|nr:Phosphate metabolism transcription is regulated by PHO system [Pseudogymnoascus destructans]ELR09358.1 hypothetical protein GMDG_03924 [Pseudogymnoascus destructans 20631-21]OAF61051.1 Phosphate metabolism transcription is regulated by PHO system [Pseudogymnoascus destructans]
MRTLVILAVAIVAVAVGALSEDGGQIVIGGHSRAKEGKKFSGRFLHITDLHPDPYYKPHTSLTTCHRTPGPSLPYGTPLSDCDSPLSLVNATLSWIDAHLPAVDFVIWTGDSARHDRDEQIPRTAAEITDTNTQLADAFREAFADKGVPVVPTLGNNDILPHNILLAGPNKWLQTYGRVWHHFIPEAQRHGFQRGGWFTVDVIPGRLAVVSLNTLYFFERNSAVNGCAKRSEPGWEQMEWLGIQLGFMRDRGVKAILMGHVPPARTGRKKLWDESCWGRYVVWVERYRDVVVGGAWGHMNIDHFLLQKGKNGVKALMGPQSEEVVEGWAIGDMGGDVAIASVDEYLGELRDGFAKVPDPRDALKREVEGESRGEREKRKRALKRMGGEWAKRYQVSLVSPSVVPNYFPSLRVVEYNVSGLDGAVGGEVEERATATSWGLPGEDEGEDEDFDEEDSDDEDEVEDEEEDGDAHTDGKKDKKKKKYRKPTHPKHPDLKIPPPPPRGSPPGPAYSPQPLSWTGYTQYFANLTRMAEAEAAADAAAAATNSNGVDVEGGGKGKNGKGGKGGKDKPKHGDGGEFKYEIEYTTFNDSKGFALPDLTVRSFLGLAHRIGRAKGGISSFGAMESAEEVDAEAGAEVDAEAGAKEDEVRGLVERVRNWFSDDDEDVEAEGKKKKKKKKKNGKGKKGENKKRERAWKVFVNRAFVGTGAEERMGSSGVSERERGEGGGGGVVDGWMDR